MPKSDTLEIRNAIDRAFQVRDAYAALTDLALGDGSASSGDDCFSGLKRQNLITLIDILNDRLVSCLDDATRNCDCLDDRQASEARHARSRG